MECRRKNSAIIFETRFGKRFSLNRHLLTNSVAVRNLGTENRVLYLPQMN